MSTLSQKMYGVFGGLAVTAILLGFLLAGSLSATVPAKAGRHGAVRLSNFKEAPVQKPETYTTADVPVVQPMEHISPASDLSATEPMVEMDMPAMDMELAPEAVGAMPIAGLSELARPSAPSAPGGGALTLGEVDEQPRPLYAPQPLYPLDAKARGEQYVVAVHIILGKDGGVRRATPIGQTPESEPFHAAAVQAVKQWRFVPCKKDGKAVQCKADQPFTFSLTK